MSYNSSQGDVQSLSLVVVQPHPLFLILCQTWNDLECLLCSFLPDFKRPSASPSCAIQSMPALAPGLQSHNEQVQSGKGTRTWDPSSKKLFVGKVPTRERNVLMFPVVYMAVGYTARGLAVLAAMIPPMIAVGKKWEAMKITRKKVEITGIVHSF